MTTLNTHYPNFQIPQKLTIIGAGAIGTALWAELSATGAAKEICVQNRTDRFRDEIFQGIQRSVDQVDIIRAPEGKATSQFRFTTNLDEAIAGSEIVIITAGVARDRPEQTRAELIDKNLPLIDYYAEAAARLAPNATYIIATNPVDVLTARFHQQSGIDPHRIMGLSGVLDRARMVQAISNTIHVSTDRIIGAKVIGQHGPKMIPQVEHVIIKNEDGSKTALKDLLAAHPDLMQKIVDETIIGGEIMTKLLGKSDFRAPAAALAFMANSVTRAKNGAASTIEASTYIPGHNIYIGQTVELTNAGEYKYTSMDLTESETIAWRQAVSTCKQDVEALPRDKSPGQSAAA